MRKVRRKEIVQRRDTRHHRRKRGRNFRIAVIGQVHSSFGRIVVHLQVKCSLDVRNGSVKLNVDAPFAHFMNLQAVILKPVGHRGNVGVGRTIEFAEFVGTQPMVEVGRRGVILPLVERGQRRLLLRAAFQHHNHALEELVGVNPAHVEFRPRHRMHIAGQPHPLCIVHLLHYAIHYARWNRFELRTVAGEARLLRRCGDRRFRFPGTDQPKLE